MKYVSIDIETLGLDPNTCDTIEFGAVIDDLSNPKPLKELPRFHTYLVKLAGVYHGEPLAMALHTKILRRIAEREEGYTYTQSGRLGREFGNFLLENGYENVVDGNLYVPAGYTPQVEGVVVAGKNFNGFDMRFLRRLLHFETHIRFHHRALDPMPLYALSTDPSPPSMKTCLERAGIEKEVAHTAVEDALDVIRLLRVKLLR